LHKLDLAFPHNNSMNRDKNTTSCLLKLPKWNPFKNICIAAPFLDSFRQSINFEKSRRPSKSAPMRSLDERRKAFELAASMQSRWSSSFRWFESTGKPVANSLLFHFICWGRRSSPALHRAGCLFNKLYRAELWTRCRCETHCFTH
jgi:hypothetical protein